MSTIDSGLGWSCDSDYYVSDANTLVGWGTQYDSQYYKTAAGGALAAKIRFNDGFNSAVLMSTVEVYSKMTVSPTATATTYPYERDGVTWYVTVPPYAVRDDGSPSDYPWICYDDPLDGNAGFAAQIGDIVEAMISEANVQYTVDRIPTTNWVKTFVEGVDAETATRVNALDTAKQPKTMSAAVSVGGVSQSTVEDAIGAMATKISKIDFDIHRNLGTEITAAQKLAIANGTFEDLPIGAYWTLNSTVYRIAHHDYYLGTGDPECTSHHIVVVPDNKMYSAVMNDTDTTAGGYAGSKMRIEGLATALSTFETDFGAAHILNHRIMITNAVSNGQASGNAWVDCKVDLMSENMVYGHAVWGQSAHETGIDRGQLVLFSLYPELIQKQRSWYWLRSVRSESDFSIVTTYGLGNAINASTSGGGVRPYACIYFDDVLGG